MKKIISICIGFILFLWIVMFAASCTPVKIVETMTTDSTGKPVKTKIKYYQQTYGHSVQHSDVHVITSPLFYNRVPVMVPVSVYRAPIIRARSSYSFRHRH
jgi:hypothetical protein